MKCLKVEKKPYLAIFFLSPLFCFVFACFFYQPIPCFETFERSALLLWQSILNWIWRSSQSREKTNIFLWFRNWGKIERVKTKYLFEGSIVNTSNKWVNTSNKLQMHSIDFIGFGFRFTDSPEPKRSECLHSNVPMWLLWSRLGKPILCFKESMGFPCVFFKFTLSELFVNFMVGCEGGEKNSDHWGERQMPSTDFGVWCSRLN